MSSTVHRVQASNGNAQRYFCPLYSVDDNYEYRSLPSYADYAVAHDHSSAKLGYASFQDLAKQNPKRYHERKPLAENHGQALALPREPNQETSSHPE